MPAPLTGGVARWNIIADTKLSDILPEVFAAPPQIMRGFLREQIESAIPHRAPLAWELIRSRNIFGGPHPTQTLTSKTATLAAGFASN
jgi:hypothetical protein